MGLTQGNIIVGLGDGFIKVGTYGQVEGSAVDLGATEGGAELSVPREYYEKMCDQAVGVLELIKFSEKGTLKVVLAEATLDNLRIAMDYPAGALAGQELKYGGNADVNELTIYLNVVAPTKGTRKYTFHKAVCMSAVPHSYKKNEKTMIECEFSILQDTSKTTNQQFGSVVDTGADITAPTVELTAPVDAGTVTKDAKGTVTWTVTEANPLNENSIVYGDEDGATFAIYNVTNQSAITLVAGSISYNPTTKEVVFTPTNNWTASDKLMAVVTTGLQDVAGNNLASQKIEHFEVTA